MKKEGDYDKLYTVIQSRITVLLHESQFMSRSLYAYKEADSDIIRQCFILPLSSDRYQCVIKDYVNLFRRGARPDYLWETTLYEDFNRLLSVITDRVVSEQLAIIYYNIPEIEVEDMVRKDLLKTGNEECVLDGSYKRFFPNLQPKEVKKGALIELAVSRGVDVDHEDTIHTIFAKICEKANIDVLSKDHIKIPLYHFCFRYEINRIRVHLILETTDKTFIFEFKYLGDKGSTPKNFREEGDRYNKMVEYFADMNREFMFIMIVTGRVTSDAMRAFERDHQFSKCILISELSILQNLVEG
jgi:hypothetical protein